MAEAEKSERALAHLRDTFGECGPDMPRNLLRFLTNEAPWTHEWVVWLSDGLTRLSRASGYQRFLRRLIADETFDEALSVLQVAERLHAVGLEVAFETPAIVAEARKVPDLFVNDVAADTAFHCEVSVLFSSDRETGASSVSDRLRQIVWPLGEESLSVAGLLWLPETDEEAESLLGRIWWETLEVRRDQRFREVHIANKLDFALAPPTDGHRVRKWAEARGYTPEGFGVVPRPVDHAIRLRAKIAEKVKQLPNSAPNILVIPGQSLFLAVQEPIDLLPMLRDTLSSFPTVAVLVLSATFLCSARPLTISSDDHFRVLSCRDGLEHQFLAVMNPTCLVNMPASTFAHLHAAFSL